MDKRRFRSLLIAALCALIWSTAVLAQAGLRVLVQHAPLAGFQFHAAGRLWPQLRVGDSLELRREPENRHDARAIAVFWRGEMIGYLPRAENDAVAQAMDRGVRSEARIADLRETADPWKRMQIDVFLVFPKNR
jgi:hypothetical protein